MKEKKKIHGRCPKNCKVKVQKDNDPKKNRALRIHSTLSGHKMPEQLKNGRKNHGKCPKWVTEKQRAKKNQGIPNPLNIEWTRNAQVAEKGEKILKNF